MPNYIFFHVNGFMRVNLCKWHVVHSSTPSLKLLLSPLELVSQQAFADVANTFAEAILNACLN